MVKHVQIKRAYSYKRSQNVKANKCVQVDRATPWLVQNASGYIEQLAHLIERLNGDQTGRADGQRLLAVDLANGLLNRSVVGQDDGCLVLAQLRAGCAEARPQQRVPALTEILLTEFGWGLAWRLCSRCA